MSTGGVSGVRPPEAGRINEGETRVATGTPAHLSDVLDESSAPINFDRKPAWSPKNFFANIFGGGSAQKAIQKEQQTLLKQITEKESEIKAKTEELRSANTKYKELDTVLANMNESLKTLEETIKTMKGIDLKKCGVSDFEVVLHGDNIKMLEEGYSKNRDAFLRNEAKLKGLRDAMGELNEVIEALQHEKSDMQTKLGLLKPKEVVTSLAAGSALCGCLGRLK